MTVSQNVIDAAGQAGIFLNGLLASNRQARIEQGENRRRTGGEQEENRRRTGGEQEETPLLLL